MFIERPIYLFSSIDHDPAFDDAKFIQRVKINDQFLAEEFGVHEDFEKCLVIFDDIDVITDKKKKAKLISLLNMILETGRKAHTSCIYTSHIACNAAETRKILNECHAIVFFQQRMTEKKIEYLLENYSGMRREDRERLVRDTSSRWTCLLKTYPCTVMRQNKIEIC